MRQLTAEMEEELRRAVELAAASVGLAEAVEAVYDELAAEIQIFAPRCDASGRCCRFEEFGHLLFVSTAELAVFLANRSRRTDSGTRAAPDMGPAGHSNRLQVLPEVTPTADAASRVGGRCVFQAGTRCSVHEIRPFGCRIFFCDPAAQEWQKTQYARFHAKLKELHCQRGVPYLYVEWQQALAVLGVTARVDCE